MSRTSARGRLGLPAHEGHDLVLRDIGVDERQRARSGRTRRKPGDRLGRRVALGVGEDRRVARDPPEHRDVRTAGLVQDRQQRQRDGDGHPGQRRREDHAAEGRHRQQEIRALPGEIAAQLAEVDQAQDRGDDDRRQDRRAAAWRRSVRGRSRSRGSSAAVISDESWVRLPAASPVADWLKLASTENPPNRPARRVRGAERDQLLVRVDLVAVADAERARRADRFGQRQEDDPERAGDEEDDVAERDLRDAGQRDPGRHVADDRHALRLRGRRRSTARSRRPARRARRGSSARGA